MAPALKKLLVSRNSWGRTLERRLGCGHGRLVPVFRRKKKKKTQLEPSSLVEAEEEENLFISSRSSCALIDSVFVLIWWFSS